MKSQRDRLIECMNLRTQWKQKMLIPFPEELVESMNVFVRGTSMSGTVDLLGHEFQYAFLVESGEESYIKLATATQN